MARDILLDIKNGIINKSEAIKFLISLIENSDDVDFRIECINTIGNIKVNNNNAFKVLENCLISDENLLIRAAAGEIIVKYYLNEALRALNWTIENEDSLLVLATIFKVLKDINDNLSVNLREKINQKFSNIYDVVFEEAKFILDLYSLAIGNIEELKDHVRSHRFDGGPFQIPKFYNYYLTPRIEIKQKHIISLDLFFWKLKELPESLGSLSKLKYLTLGSENLEKMPKSFGSLKELKWVELSSLPKFETVPDWILSIAKKCYAKLYSKVGVNVNEAIVLGLFDLLIGYELYKLGKYQDVQNHSQICAYRLNQNGCVSELYLSNPKKFKLSIIPEQISNLKSLTTLDLNNNDINKLPDSIGTLKALKYLDLSNNSLKILSNSIVSLKSLEYLDLSGNNIKELPESFKELKSLKTLRLDNNLIQFVPQTLKSVIKNVN